MKVYYEVTLKGFIDLDTDDPDEAEEQVRDDTPAATLIALADISEAAIHNVEAQV